MFAAGFAEAGEIALQEDLRAAAAASAMPVIGPNCDGLVSFHARAALWGDALIPRPAGRVAIISQSGNVAVNALAVDRGLRFHTVASVGNQAVLDAATLSARWSRRTSSGRSRCSWSPTATAPGWPRHWRAQPSAASASQS